VGRLVVSELATLDEVIEDPVGTTDFERGGWAFDFDQGEDGRQIKLEEAFLAEAVLMGRGTYDYFAADSLPEDEFGLAERFMEIPKYVVSSTLEKAKWENTTVLRGDIVQQTLMLKDTLEGDILVPGSAQLVRMLFQEDLIDEIRIMLYPIVLGEGKQLLQMAKEQKPMKLARRTTVGGGICYFILQPRELDEVSDADSYEPRVI
jgi:dihydrofolate reductase